MICRRAFDRKKFVARKRVPNPNRVPIRSRNDSRSVRGELGGYNPGRMTQKRMKQSARRRIPNPHTEIASRDDPLSVWGKTGRHEFSAVSLQRVKQTSGLRIPDITQSVVA